MKKLVTNEFIENYNNSGINGRLFTSKVNGNTLFFPFCGLISLGNLRLDNDVCEFWAKTIKKEYESPLTLFMSYGDSKWTRMMAQFQRFNGLTVRGVINKKEPR